MSGRWLARAAGAAVALALSACADRSRPSDGPFAPVEETSSSLPTLIRISSPVPGQVFQRADLGAPPGVEVVLTGTFVPGHDVLLEGLFLPYGPGPFFATRYRIDSSVTSMRVRAQGEPFHFLTAGSARIYVRVFDGGPAPISVGSVTVTVQ